MNDDNVSSIRRFLKMVGGRSLHEIEQAIAKSVSSGQLKGNESIPEKSH